MRPSTKRLRTIRLTFGLTAALTLLLVGMGGFVRGTGAGLSCPDWPLCFGRAVPEQLLHPGVVQEVLHRYLASIVGLLIVWLSFRAYRLRLGHPGLWRAAKFLLLVLISQVILGGLTVLMLLNPFIVTAHLAFGTVLFQTLALVAVERFRVKGQRQEPQGMVGQTPDERRLELFARALPPLVFAQMLLGGFVGASGASFACPDIPLCYGRVLPDLSSGPQIIHMVHRATAVLILGVVSYLLYLGRWGASRPSIATGHLFGLVFMVAVQIALGLSSVYFGVPVALAVAHLLVGQLILLAALTFRRSLVPGMRFFSAVAAGGMGSAAGVGSSRLKEFAPA